MGSNDDFNTRNPSQGNVTETSAERSNASQSTDHHQREPTDPETGTTRHARDEGAPVNRSLGGLFADLARDASRLVRKETELAKAEATENTSQAISGVVFVIIAAVVVLAGLIVLLDAAVYGIAQFLPPELTLWLPALIVGAVVTLIGIGLLMKGRSDLRTRNLMPDRTIESVRRDEDVARDHARRNREVA